MERANKLGQEKISKLLLSFSAPAIVGMLVNSLYNVIDRIFIGNGVGSLGIGGITIGFPIMIIMIAFAMMIGIGSTSLVSIRLGERNKEEAEKIIGNALILFVVVSIILTVLGMVFLDPLLTAFGADGQILPYARDYMSVIMLGTVFMCIGFGMNNFIRAEGNPRIAMLTMIISALINAVLAPVFIYVFNWGMKGAGLATVTAQAVSAIWVFAYFLRGNSSLKIRRKNLRLQPSLVKNIIFIGSAPFAMQMANGLLNIVLNKTLLTYGNDTAVSGMGIINSIATLLIMPVIGISQGAQPIIGYNYGARQFHRVKETLKLAIGGATIIVLIGFVVTRLFPYQFITLFNSDDAELIRFGTRAITTFFMLLPIIGFQIISANYFQAVGKAKPAMFLSLSRQVLILIPAVILLPKFYGLYGILYAGPLADLLSSIITGIWLFMELKRLKQKQLEEYA